MTGVCYGVYHSVAYDSSIHSVPTLYMYTNVSTYHFTIGISRCFKNTSMNSSLVMDNGSCLGIPTYFP